MLIEEKSLYGNPAPVRSTCRTYRFRIPAEKHPLNQVIDCRDTCCDVRVGEEISVLFLEGDLVHIRVLRWRWSWRKRYGM